MKIGFATDTNILRKNKLSDCQKILDVTDMYTDYIESLNKIKSSHELIYYMPEIVVDELLIQKEFSFNQAYKFFEDRYKENSYGLLGELPQNNIKEILAQEKEKYKEKYKLIKLEYTAELMETLVKEALMKKAPFDKSIEGKKTDAGFKDALIWKTVVLSTDIDECEEFYFFTSDKAFGEGKEELINEFKVKHPKTNIFIIYIEPDGSHRQNALNHIIDKHGLYKTDVIELYDENVVKKYFGKISYIPNDIEYYCGNGIQAELTKVLFQNFDLDDFYIDKVEKTEEKFNIYCSFRTLKHNTDIEISDKKYIIGNVKFIVKGKKEKYAYINSEVSKVDFDLGVVDLLRGFTVGLGNFTKEISKIVKENAFNIESFNALKTVQEAIEKQNKEREAMVQAMSNPLKDLRIPTAIDILKEKINYKKW